MKFQQCLWDLEEQEPQAISQAECAHIYNGEPVYYFGNIDNEQQDREQFEQAKQQLIKLLEKVTNTIPDHDPNVTDQHSNSKPINKQPLRDFIAQVQSNFNYDISSDIKKALLNWIKKQLEDLCINHSSRLEQAKGFSTDKLELDVCWAGVATKLGKFIDSVRVDVSLPELVVKAKRQMLLDLASAYCASKTSNGVSGVHFAGYYFNSLASSYGLIPISWESNEVDDPDDFLKYVQQHQDNAFWEKLIGLIDDFFPQELGDGMSPFERVRELMDEVVPKDDNNSAWLRFFMGDVAELGSLSNCLEEQTRQRLARLFTSYLMAQQGYLSPNYCRTLKVKVAHNSDNNQNKAESIEVLSSKRLLPDHEQWFQYPSDQSGGDEEVSDNQNIETVYYYLTAEDIFIHIEGVIRPASQADLELIKDDLKNYQLPVPAANLQYLDRYFVLGLNCLPSITMPSLGISLSGDSQKLQEDLASDPALKNYIKQQFIRHYELLMMDIEGVNPDPNYKIKSPLLHALFWQLYKDNLSSDQLTDDDKRCFQLLTGCQRITTFGKLNEWLINNTDNLFLQGTDNLSTINHLFWQVYEEYHDEEQFLPKETLFFQVVTGNCDLKSQSEVQDWLIESVVRGDRPRADLAFGLTMFAAQNGYKKVVQDFFNNCLNKQIAWYQFGDSFGRNILHIAMCQFDIAYEFLRYVPVQSSPSLRGLGSSYELSSRVSHDSLSVDMFKKLNQFDHKTPLHYMAEKGSIKALDWLVKTVCSNNVTELLTGLLSQHNELNQSACQIALANNQQPFLRQFFCLVIQKMAIQRDMDTDSAILLDDSIHTFFLNTNENKIELLTHALSQGIIESLENETAPSECFLLDCRNPGGDSLLDIIIRHKKWRFFWELLNNDRSQGWIVKLFAYNPQSFCSFLKDDYSCGFLDVLTEKLTDKQFQSLLLSDISIHCRNQACQVALANNQQFPLYLILAHLMRF